jgi:hypothetical protein
LIDLVLIHGGNPENQYTVLGKGLPDGCFKVR